MSLENKNKKK